MYTVAWTRRGLDNVGRLPTPAGTRHPSLAAAKGHCRALQRSLGHVPETLGHTWMVLLMSRL